VATVRFIVNSALRKLGRLGAGREPRVADQTDTLAALQGLYGAWIAAGSFGRLNAAVILDDYCARPNEHILRHSEAAQRVILPGFEWCHDFSRNEVDPILDGNGGAILDSNGQSILADPIVERATYEHRHPPRDGAVVMISDEITGNTQAYLYEGATKRWQSVNMLQLDQQAPRSSADPGGLAASLALEVADTFGAEVGQATIRQANRFIAAMVQRFSETRRESAGVYC
jgi:hypothetical protein